jgi:hypothetical protein
MQKMLAVLALVLVIGLAHGNGYVFFHDMQNNTTYLIDGEEITCRMVGAQLVPGIHTLTIQFNVSENQTLPLDLNTTWSYA